MEGQITKILSNLYFVTADDKVYQCHSRGKFRKNNITPLVGDYVVLAGLAFADQGGVAVDFGKLRVAGGEHYAYREGCRGGILQQTEHQRAAAAAHFLRAVVLSDKGRASLRE